MRVLCYDVCKRLAVLVFTDKEDRPHAPSPKSSLYWFTKGMLENPLLAKKRGRSFRSCGLALLLFINL